MHADRKIMCFHTLHSNIAVFDEVAREIGVAVEHRVREDLLVDAERAGDLTDEIVARTIEAIEAEADGYPVLVLTCSTVGPAADRMRELGDTRVIRVDDALAREVGSGTGRAVVLFTNPATRGPTQKLFGARAGSQIALDYVLVDGAWDAFWAGDLDGYFGAVAKAADAAYDDGARTVAFAQASMAGAVAMCRKGRPLTSPHVGLMEAKDALG